MENTDNKVVEPVQPQAYWVTINGEKFACTECGCKLFHHPKPEDQNLWECNACETWFRSE